MVASGILVVWYFGILVVSGHRLPGVAHFYGRSTLGNSCGEAAVVWVVEGEEVERAEVYRFNL